MQSNYNFWLVAVSLIVATLASFTAIDLADRLSILAYARARHLWLAAGALAMGVGIWSMHFIGMLSFSLSIPIGYDFTLTCYSLVIAVLVSWFALHVVTRQRLKLSHVLAGGVLIGRFGQPGGVVGALDGQEGVGEPELMGIRAA